MTELWPFKVGQMIGHFGQGRSQLFVLGVQLPERSEVGFHCPIRASHADCSAAWREFIKLGSGGASPGGGSGG